MQNVQPANPMAFTHTLCRMQEALIARWPAVSAEAPYLHADMQHLAGRAGRMPTQSWSTPTDVYYCQWHNFCQVCQ